ncbi:MAG TPA: AAA family ATPase [Gammaproteobacteria bacterium]|nr:AAA family ATPase [Gammaproteobacteria bacterium]
MKNNIEKAVALGIDVLRRVSRFLPESNPIDWKQTSSAVWINKGWTGELTPVAVQNNITLKDLLEIDRQKNVLVANTEQFCKGYPANNALLWGARGTGKSSLIQALINHFHEYSLRYIEVDKHALRNIAVIVEEIRTEPYRFILVCDDLSFEADDPSYKEVKSALEGSIIGTSSNVLIYATSNRRHLLPEQMEDNLSASYEHGELHQAEAVEEKISLSDRFGIWLSFAPFTQEQYLRVVEYWLQALGDEFGVTVPWNKELETESIRWALGRGVRSGRTAHHFARHHVGQILLGGPS